MTPASRRRHGLSLIEVVLLLSLLGVTLAVAVPTFLRSVRTSKIAEASENLERMLRGASSYYDGSHEGGEGLRVQCIPPAAGPAPPVPSMQPVLIDFLAPTTAGSETWRALDFAPQEPVRYRYTFATTEAGCLVAPAAGTLLFSVRAEGDLDGDQKLSRFERQVMASGDGSLSPHPMLITDDRVE